MKALVLALLLVAGTVQADTKGRNAAFHECISCRARCHAAHDRDACERTCFEIKRAMCAAAGAPPGPYKSCTCG